MKSNLLLRVLSSVVKNNFGVAYTVTAGAGCLLFVGAFQVEFMLNSFISFADLSMNLLFPCFNCTKWANPPDGWTGIASPLIVSGCKVSDEPTKNVVLLLIFIFSFLG